MSNYTLNNVRRFITHIDEDEYWDMHLNSHGSCGDVLSDDCIGAAIDTTNDVCLEGNGLVSLPDYSYDGACNPGLRLENIGYTGVDNGLISYRKDRITNAEFYKIYTNSVYELESGDTRLHLHQVTGMNFRRHFQTK